MHAFQPASYRAPEQQTWLVHFIFSLVISHKMFCDNELVTGSSPPAVGSKQCAFNVCFSFTI